MSDVGMTMLSGFVGHCKSIREMHTIKGPITLLNYQMQAFGTLNVNTDFILMHTMQETNDNAPTQA